MDRFWQWAWDRYGARYSWVCFAFTFAALVPMYLLGSFVVVAYEKSDRYVEAAAFTVAAVLLLAYLIVLPGPGGLRTAQQWAAGREVDRARALESTYTYGRGVVARTVGAALSDAILLAHQTVDAMVAGLSGLTDRGSHAFKGKSATVQVFALDPALTPLGR